MKITIICIGKIKEKYLKDAIDDYKKRLSKYVKISIIEIVEKKRGENIIIEKENSIKDKEGENILKKINKSNNTFVISLDLKGKSLNSEEFSDFLNKKMICGTSHIYFIIGGYLGISRNVLEKSDFLLCFSNMTFTHQFIRILLLEQIYRGYKIINNEPYHK